jgi:ribosomal protein L4
MQDVVPPDASNFQKQLNKAKPHITSAVITIDTDDENDDEAASNWKQPSSMKIESLISGVDHQNIDKKAKPFE